MFDGFARHFPRQERTHGVALVEEVFEHADAVLLVCHNVH
jgi:hypothetical protein